VVGLSEADLLKRNYYWRQNPNATAYIQASEGLFIGEIVQRLEQVIHHNMTQRYGKHCVLTQLRFFR